MLSEITAELIENESEAGSNVSYCNAGSCSGSVLVAGIVHNSILKCKSTSNSNYKR